MLPVIPRGRDVITEVAALYARIGSTLAETPAQYYLDGVRAGGTIHKDEVWALEHLLDPQLSGTGFVVGASFGFSSVVMAKLLPRMRVVTVDNWSEGADVARARAACEALASMPEDPGPRLVFATGESPRDTPALLAAHAAGPLAVALIDGLHTDAQLVADYDGLAASLDERSLLLLHDVRLFDLWAGVRNIAARGAFDTLVQLNTSTGMVAAFNRAHHRRGFAFLQQMQVVAHWHPDRADAPGRTTSYPAIGWDSAADAREGRYDETPRQRASTSVPASPVAAAGESPTPAGHAIDGHPLWRDPRPARREAAIALERAGDLAGAAVAYRRLSLHWPAGRAAVRYNLASVLVRLGRGGRAAVLFRGLADDPALPAALRGGAAFHLGGLAEAGGRTAAARDYYRAALVLAPGHRDARARLEQLEASWQGADPAPQPSLPRPRSARAASRPILVYQMGKVGSTSLVAGLAAALPDVDVHHSHVLSVAALDTYERWMREDARLPGAMVASTLAQIATARGLRGRLLGDGPRWRILTLTREPLGHLVSALFHHLDLYARLSGAPPGDMERTLSHLHAYAVEAAARAGAGPVVDRSPIDPAQDALGLAHTWFDRELLPVLGLDVYAQPFDTGRGYTRVHTPRADVIVVRFEDLAWAGADAIRALCGLDGFRLPTENRGRDRASGRLYATFRQTCRFPRAVVDAVYATRYARHFYTDDERRVLADAWS